MQDKTKIPVTVLSGFPRAGKTSVLNHILNNLQTLNVAVITNDKNKGNIDSRLPETGTNLSRTKEDVMQMNNVCIYSMLSDDWVNEVIRLVQNGQFDYFLVEADGIAEPRSIAQTFSRTSHNGVADLTKIMRLDTMVTVVDALNFGKDYMSFDSIADRGLKKGDNRNVTDILTNQIEFADVIIINKADLSSPYALEEMKRVMKKFNPEARVIGATYGKIDPSEILSTGLFNFKKTSPSAWWITKMKNECSPEPDEFGISSFVYRSQKPFHCKRFEDYINNHWHHGILRSKGFYWLLEQPNDVLLWNQSGRISTVQKAGVWWASLPIKERNQHAVFQANEEKIMAEWDKRFGDRHTEIFFIGVDMPVNKITIALNKCLCNDDEMEKLNI